jgi:hypothetical protein
MLAENAKKAANSLGLDLEIKMSMDVNELRRFGMPMMNPVLIIDGKIEIAGEVASVEKIKKLILAKGPFEHCPLRTRL